jgi:hypothetical protein
MCADGGEPPRVSIYGTNRNQMAFVSTRACTKVEPMSGGTKPTPHTRRAAKYQDGAKKGGGVKTAKHAGPGRASKTSPQGTNGRQLQRRAQP